MGAVSQLLAQHGVSVIRGRVIVRRDQGIVKGFNRTLAEQLFGHRYAQEMQLPERQRSTEWVTSLPAVIIVWNGEVTRQLELPRPIRIRPRMYVRRSIMYEKAAFCSPEENSSVAR